MLHLCYQYRESYSLTNTSASGSAGISSGNNMFFQLMIPALYKRGQLSWNPTVNKMTALALQKLQVGDFLEMKCNQLLLTIDCQALDEGLFFEVVEKMLAKRVSRLNGDSPTNHTDTTNTFRPRKFLYL